MIADSVPAELTLTGEAVLENIAPLVTPGRVIAQGGQGHPQVSGREHAELVTQPSAGATIVGNRNHRRDLVGDQPQGRERSRQTMPAPKGNHGRTGHSRPRSRWTRKVATSWLFSRDASASATATERCFPPVQPTARVT